MMIHTQHSPIHSSLYIFFLLYFPPFFFFFLFLFFLFSLFHSFFLLGLQIKSSYTGIPDLARSFSLFFISRPVLFASCVLLSTDFDRLTRSFFPSPFSFRPFSPRQHTLSSIKVGFRKELGFTRQ